MYTCICVYMCMYMDTEKHKRTHERAPTHTPHHTTWPERSALTALAASFSAFHFISSSSPDISIVTYSRSD